MPDVSSSSYSLLLQKMLCCLTPENWPPRAELSRSSAKRLKFAEHRKQLARVGPADSEEVG